MLCAGLRAFDVDPKVGGFAAEVVRCLRPYLPRGALVRRRGQSDSIVFVVRAAEGTPGKLKVLGQRGAVEVLGHGQQLLIDGWHPSDPTSNTRWWWMHDRAPWTVPLADLPAISEEAVAAILQAVQRVGVLGAPVQQQGRNGVRRGRYPATGRLRCLLRQHGGLVRPAVSALITEVGAAGTGRHDALVALGGFFVAQRWPVADAMTFLLPLVDAAFGTDEGSWAGEIESALQHARRRERARAV
jgi:hypothetical protein